MSGQRAAQPDARAPLGVCSANHRWWRTWCWSPRCAAYASACRAEVGSAGSAGGMAGGSVSGVWGDIAAGFDEASRRDPVHHRPWVALVDYPPNAKEPPPPPIT
jgi:hypothetical protein